MQRRHGWFYALSLLVLLSLACSLLGGGGGNGGNDGNGGGGGGGAGGGGGGGGGGYNTQFPLPDDVSNFTDTGNQSINFQTGLSLQDAMKFYRDAFTGKGLTERTINTVTSDTTFSMVFDGDPSGKAIVVQGVDLGGGKTNINIRYEDV